MNPPITTTAPRTQFSVKELLAFVVVIAIGFAAGNWGGLVFGLFVAASGILLLRAGWKRWLLVTAAVAVAGYYFSTEGGIGEFLPDTLEFRYRSERLLPIAQIPVYQSGYNKDQYGIVEYLIQKGYWQAREVEVPQWILMYHSNRQWKDGHSRLHAELSWRGKEWMQWSEEHPELASVVWPIVLGLIRSDQQSEATALLWHAKHSETEADFWKAVNSDVELYHLGLGRVRLPRQGARLR